MKTSRMNEMIEEGTFSFSPRHLLVGLFTDVIFPYRLILASLLRVVVVGGRSDGATRMQQT